MHETRKEKFPDSLRICVGATMKVIKYSIAARKRCGSFSLSLSLPLDVVTYFLRLIDKGSYMEGNAVMKVYEVGGTKRD